MGLLGSARTLQRDLERMTRKANTNCPEGLHYLLQGEATCARIKPHSLRQQRLLRIFEMARGDVLPHRIRKGQYTCRLYGCWCLSCSGGECLKLQSLCSKCCAAVCSFLVLTPATVELSYHSAMWCFGVRIQCMTMTISTYQTRHVQGRFELA